MVGFECCGGDGLQVVVVVVGFICGWREEEREIAMGEERNGEEER